ncbi:hypothetical protein LINPERPRIM_LOCUS26454 [Linum perenne]
MHQNHFHSYITNRFSSTTIPSNTRSLQNINFWGRLWDRFFRGHTHYYNIYVHADPSTEVQIPSSSAFESSLIPRRKTERASPTLIDVERHLLARAILDDPLNLNFASAFYPYPFIPLLLPLAFGGQFVKIFYPQSRHRSFIEILSDDPNLPEMYVARGENMMMLKVSFEEFQVGSQFFVLAKRHAVVVLSYKKLWRKFRLKCLNLRPLQNLNFWGHFL